MAVSAKSDRPAQKGYSHIVIVTYNHCIAAGQVGNVRTVGHGRMQIRFPDPRREPCPRAAEMDRKLLSLRQASRHYTRSFNGNDGVTGRVLPARPETFAAAALIADTISSVHAQDTLSKRIYSACTRNRSHHFRAAPTAISQTSVSKPSCRFLSIGDVCDKSAYRFAHKIITGLTQCCCCSVCRGKHQLAITSRFHYPNFSGYFLLHHRPNAAVYNNIAKKEEIGARGEREREREIECQSWSEIDRDGGGRGERDRVSVGWCNQEWARINGEKPRKHCLIFCASSSRQRTRRGARDRVDGGGSRVFRQRPCVRVRLRRGKPVRTVRFGVCIECLSVCVCVNDVGCTGTIIPRRSGGPFDDLSSS
ncbi:Uncharacterized protein FWK35_00023928 [Aphis craccivora]|uniref:Uncharacterized protein n=1 Tax=Aphis craccivora TaxID=307492 RepID=A0A6G0Z686_APHCR|nr:Uncharacterized protein FWK35_00023928 [Aphis craccivora]